MSSGLETGGMTCDGAATQLTWQCPGPGLNTTDGLLSPALSNNCGCYFDWKNINSLGESNIYYVDDPGYSTYCAPVVNSVPPKAEYCIKWSDDTTIIPGYYSRPSSQACTDTNTPQKAWQRLRYAPSVYISENTGELGKKVYFPFPIYDTDGTTPLKRPDGGEYTTDNNGEVTQCDCSRLQLFSDASGLIKIRIDPTKRRITDGNGSNHIRLVAYFALPNKAGSKGSDTYEHGFCVIDAIRDCDFQDEDQYCHGKGRRENTLLDQQIIPSCMGEFGIKSYNGTVWFVDSAGQVSQIQETISEQDTIKSSVPDSNPPYSTSLGVDGLRLENVLYSRFGAILFNVDSTAEGTLTYSKNSTQISELVQNSIDLSKFYKVRCCGGVEERIANVMLKRDVVADGTTTFIIDDTPVFNCPGHDSDWWNVAMRLISNSKHLDKYNISADQYDGIERKQQTSSDDYLNWFTYNNTHGGNIPYVSNIFGCSNTCGSCDTKEAAVFASIKNKLCGSPISTLRGFGGITFPDDTVFTPKYHVPESIRTIGNSLNDLTYYCKYLNIDPITKYGSLGAKGSAGSTLHSDNIILSNDYTQGRCVNVETPAGTILPYQDSVRGTLCNDYTVTSPITNQNDQRCNWYWAQRFDDSSGDQALSRPGIPTAMEYHWLSGGYFYGTKALRDNIYKELGTIHFNTSVNINNFAYDITTQDKTPKDYTIKINTATEYLDTRNLWDIALSNISMGFATDNGAAAPDVITGLKPIIKYNSSTNGYFSTYSQEIINQYINTESLTPSRFTVEMGTGQTTIKQSGSFVRLISSKTGLPAIWPKTDNYFTLHTPAQLSFLVDAGSGASYNYTYYNIVSSPTTLSILPADTGTPVTTLEYFANNAIESSMAFITDAIPITNYENYKFFGSVMSANTIEISGSTSDIIYNNLNTKVTTTSTTKLDYLMSIKSQITSNPDTVGFLNLYNYTVNGTNNINIVLDPTTNILINGGKINRLQEFLDATGNITKIIITLNEDIPLLSGKTYGYGYSLPFMIKLISLYSGTTTNLNNQNKEGILTQNTVTNNFAYNPTFPIKNFNNVNNGSSLVESDEYPLFDLNSSKFSTPDYSFIKLTPVSEQNLGTEQIIPLRGAEYSTSEKQSYPTYRTIRKANGKYYLQILAGAFPYFHSVVHLPAIKGVSRNDNQDSAVEDSLLKVCSKNIDWYNHVATTKWTCLVKHTQFSQNLPDYKKLVNTTAGNQTGKPIIISRFSIKTDGNAVIIPPVAYD